jgi:hypothetical protein
MGVNIDRPVIKRNTHQLQGVAVELQGIGCTRLLELKLIDHTGGFQTECEIQGNS